MTAQIFGVNELNHPLEIDGDFHAGRYARMRLNHTTVPGTLWERVSDPDPEDLECRGHETSLSIYYCDGSCRICERGPLVGYGITDWPHIMRVVPKAGGIIRAGIRVR